MTKSGQTIFKPALAKDIFSKEDLFSLNKFKSHFIGHPTKKVSGIEHNTGALGHGLSVAVGMAIGLKLDSKKFKVFTLLGDGELSEGSIWEGLLSANKYNLDNLVVIVDRNKLQITGKTEDINPIESLKDKFNSFGLSTKEVDGNSVHQLNEVLSNTPFEKNKVNVVIANTVKGKGISFMENEIVWHHKVPSDEQYKLAQNELEELKLNIEND